MIGLSLGVTGGTAFNSLLAALSFHQARGVRGVKAPSWCRLSQLARGAAPGAHAAAPLARHTPPSSPAPSRPVQFFEGLALGSAAVQAGIATRKALLLGLVYSLSTPLGTAIGAPPASCRRAVPPATGRC